MSIVRSRERDGTRSVREAGVRSHRDRASELAWPSGEEQNEGLMEGFNFMLKDSGGVIWSDV